MTKRHGAGIERFRRRQLRVRKWINFAEIAHWCSKEAGSIIRDERKRAAAFDTLARDALAGDFEENGKSLVLYLHPVTEKARMTREWLRNAINYSYDNANGRSQFLPYCWIPRRMFEAWLKKHRLEPPAWLQPVVDRTKGTQQKRSRTETDFAHKVIKAAFPTGVPDKTMLRNKSFLDRILEEIEKIPADQKPSPLPSDSTYLRAARRK
jgi:hypothetical protein